MFMVTPRRSRFFCTGIATRSKVGLYRRSSNSNFFPVLTSVSLPSRISQPASLNRARAARVCSRMLPEPSVLGG
jgi:hypothetical protein